MKIGIVTRSTTSIRNCMPVSGGAGSMRKPTPAQNGLSAAPSVPTATPVPIGRSTQIVVVPRKWTSRVVVVGERCFDDLLLDPTVERDEHLCGIVILAKVDERVLLGKPINLSSASAEEVREPAQRLGVSAERLLAAIEAAMPSPPPTPAA